MNWFRTIFNGARKGAIACGRLMLILAPVFTGMAVLKYLNVLSAVAHWCRPAMKYFGLPGDAAFALVIGNFLNLYAAIGVLAALKLTTGQMTLLSLMLLISHSQILESSVFFQIRTRYQILWAIRLGVALLIGFGLHFVLAPAVGIESPVSAVSTRAASLGAATRDWGIGLIGLAWKMLAILVAIFIVLEIVRRLNLLEKSLKVLNRYTRFMGFSEAAGLPLLAGVIFGIVFGAGVITGSVKDQALDTKQVLLVSVFLALCHGIVEDTGLMILLGANILWITIPRLLLAVPAVWAVNKLYHPAPLTANR
jgi:spore maturation protein SpmB